MPCHHLRHCSSTCGDFVASTPVDTPAQTEAANFQRWSQEPTQRLLSPGPMACVLRRSPNAMSEVWLGLLRCWSPEGGGCRQGLGYAVTHSYGRNGHSPSLWNSAPFLVCLPSPSSQSNAIQSESPGAANVLHHLHDSIRSVIATNHFIVLPPFYTSSRCTALKTAPSVWQRTMTRTSASKQGHRWGKRDDPQRS